jgi:hypothetical protein
MSGLRWGHPWQLVLTQLIHILDKGTVGCCGAKLPHVKV